jgi:hypothetical protein
MKYAIKFQGEYMRQRYGSDCFTDDLGFAVLFDSREEAVSELFGDEHVVEIQEDEEGGIWEDTANGMD